ncbi:putative Flagellar hook protein FlgE [Candidatus Zixiibacteriota bacterium]|nr:putative Flagellar hook protein FlgE [candidate division Zixibacteria bacterium]
MMASLFAGVSGLRNHQTKMNVIGDNIANVNTIGFKAGRVTFQEALVQSYKGAGRPSSLNGGTNPVQLGLGMSVATIDNLFQQGGLETTGQITDLAIQGSGFFVLSNGTGRFYTRAGAFGFDANSNLVDPSTGMFVQGKMADADGNILSTATVGNITLPFGQQDPARATTRVNLGNNLNSVATESTATLQSSGTTNINTVSGTAINGAGGVHTLTLTGAQATNSTFTGTSVGDDGSGNPVVALSGNMTLGSLGVTDVTGFTLSRDNGAIVDTVSGLTLNSSINDLITAINQIDGIRAELVGGQIQLTREKAGSGTDYNITSSASSVTLNANGAATAGNIVGVVFGVADGSTLAANNGSNHSFVCNDVFTPTGGVALDPEMLDIEVDDNTGLATGIAGLGGGGVEISSLNGLSAGTSIINTADTTHSTSITVFDSQGGKHTMTIQFTKSVNPNEWTWSAAFTGNEIILGGGTGTVRFNQDGSLLSFGYNGGSTGLSFDPNNGAATVNLDINAGTAGRYDGLTGFASAHTASIMNQNGYGLGILDKISIDANGNISGIFTNGVSRVLAQIILADFNNHGGLLKAGRSLYQVSANSGQPIEGVAGETISGTLSSGALEASSVDIAQEFTNMITAQRGFQANARIITTSDNMLDELVNLKR